MHFILASALFLGSWFSPQNGKSPFINGGHPVTPPDPIYYRTVMLEMGFSSCSGTLIARDLVITAAHCLNPLPARVRIRFAGSKGSVVAVSSSYRVHENYNPEGEVDNQDLALVYFRSPPPSGYQAAKILSPTTALPKGTALTIAGYGQGSPAGRLAKITLTMMSFAASRTQLKLSQSATRGACYGDSGGPAFAMVRNEPFLTGVASYVENEDCSGYVVYTKPQSFLPWIQKTSEELRSAHRD